MRSRALALDLKSLGISCAIYGPDLKYQTPLDSQIFTHWQSPPLKEEDDVKYFINYAHRVSTKLFVIDNFGLSEDYFSQLAKRKFKWLQYVGEPSDLIYANIIVRPNPAARPQDYTKLIANVDCKILMGPKYAALRPEFQNQKEIVQKTKIKKIFINLGGGDDNGGILLLIDSLINFTGEDVELLFVSGQANSSNFKLQKILKNIGVDRITFLINPPNIAMLMASCDIAILASGTTTFEAASIGLPMLLIAHNQAQAEQAKAWEKLGVAVFCGMLEDLNMQLLEKFLCKMDLFYQQQWRRNRRVTGLNDGRGARRLSKEILALT